jgi:hypothetical protein
MNDAGPLLLLSLHGLAECEKATKQEIDMNQAHWDRLWPKLISNHPMFLLQRIALS